jgi:hypothetical protein
MITRWSASGVVRASHCLVSSQATHDGWSLLDFPTKTLVHPLQAVREATQVALLRIVPGALSFRKKCMMRRRTVKPQKVQQQLR